MGNSNTYNYHTLQAFSTLTLLYGNLQLLYECTLQALLRRWKILPQAIPRFDSQSTDRANYSDEALRLLQKRKDRCRLLAEGSTSLGLTLLDLLQFHASPIPLICHIYSLQTVELRQSNRARARVWMCIYLLFYSITYMIRLFGS